MIENTNTKDIFFRNALAGLLDYLNRNVKIEQVVEGVPGLHAIKFYYNFGQDEQFMKDFFVQLDHGCVLHQNAEGNFEIRPVGVIKFNSFVIRSTEITNKFVRGTFVAENYTDNMEKQLKAYSAYLFRLPMTIKVSVDIQADNLGQSMRVMQAILSTIYKSNIMYFQFKGMRVPAEILMADNIDLEKKTEFTYDDDQTAHAKFDFDINTNFPAFDEPSTIFKANIIKEFRLTLNDELHIVSPESFIEGLVVREFPITDPSKL